MHIIVVGAGIAGVCSAWYLLKAGHQVTVVEALDEVANDTSFANAGMLTPGYASPWAAPGVVKQSLKMLRAPAKPLVIKPDGSLEQIKWLWQMYGFCNATQFKRNRIHMHQLAKTTLNLLHELKQELSLDYHGLQAGTLEVFRAPADWQQCQNDTDFLNEHGIAHDLLSPQHCQQFEQGIDAQKFSGALRLNDDETGDCRLFAEQLTQHCQAAGAVFLFQHAVTELRLEGQTVRGVKVGEQTLAADHVVLSAGCYTQKLLQTVGIQVPIYPIKGYSMTVPIVDEAKAPQSTVLDYQYKVAITRMGKHIRVGGIAELSGWQRDKHPHNLDTLKQVLNDLFPDCADLDAAELWMGMRPATPDGPPLIGRVPLEGLSVNAGHGTFGWTLGLGSGKCLSDSLSQPLHEQQRSPFYPLRYQH